MTHCDCADTTVDTDQRVVRGPTLLQAIGDMGIARGSEDRGCCGKSGQTEQLHCGGDSDSWCSFQLEVSLYPFNFAK